MLELLVFIVIVLSFIVLEKQNVEIKASLKRIEQKLDSKNEEK